VVGVTQLWARVLLAALSSGWCWKQPTCDSARHGGGPGRLAKIGRVLLFLWHGPGGDPQEGFRRCLVVGFVIVLILCVMLVARGLDCLDDPSGGRLCPASDALWQGRPFVAARCSRLCVSAAALSFAMPSHAPRRRVLAGAWMPALAGRLRG